MIDILKQHIMFSFQVEILYLNNQKLLILSVVTFLKVSVYKLNGSNHPYLDYGQNEMEDAQAGVCRNLNLK